jgi:RNA-directed DNA polymerase
MHIDEQELFEQCFSADALFKVYESRFRDARSKGLDRLGGAQFVQRANEQLSAAAVKIEQGTYRFTPYLENLKAKGRGKPPRLIGIPTIRDRVVLCQLNRFLAACFPAEVPKNIASTYVQKITNDLRSSGSSTTWVCKADIKTFYDSINRSRLQKAIGRGVAKWQVNRLVARAVATPTVPKSSRSSDRSNYATSVGVPQGLAISNILASIFLAEVDMEMSKLGTTYYRYVDDVLLYGSESDVLKSYKSLRSRLRRRGLSMHPLGSGKTQIASISEPFEYLGYSFNWPEVTVRDSTVERFLQGIAAKSSEYAHGKQSRLARFGYLTEERVKEIFLLELNEKISGAISGNRRYGWIAYFNEITDLSLLSKMDRVIESIVRRLPDFKASSPLALKKLSRSYFEMKHRPLGSYVKNYDLLRHPLEKLALLVERGRVGQDEILSEAEIVSKFDAYLRKVLGDMHADEGMLY